MIDPTDFLDLANKLHADRRYNDEATWRTIISRAYYASFLASQKKLQELGQSFPDVDRIHQAVIEAIMEKNSAIANKLETLRKARVDSDYKLLAKVVGQPLPTLLGYAQRVINDVVSIKK